VTAIETWMRDPYALYARHILKLNALEPLDADPGAAERGQFIHQALDEFVRCFPRALADDALPALLAAGRGAFGAALSYPSVAAFWWPRFERVAVWFLEFERSRRAAGIFPLVTETRGEITISTSGQSFFLHARADRIDRLTDGRLAILDYKTGSPPDRKQVLRGFAPQLPLEGVIAERTGFLGAPAGPVGQLAFLRLGGGEPAGELTEALGGAQVDQAIAQALAGLVALVETFDHAETPYSAKPRPDFAFDGDYDHLARVGEWSA
jgi:ATP-dependent helicase/nuclease subunit B